VAWHGIHKPTTFALELVWVHQPATMQPLVRF